jgi:hypothetical protein
METPETTTNQENNANTPTTVLTSSVTVAEAEKQSELKQIISPVITETLPSEFGLADNTAVGMLMGLVPTLAERNLLIQAYAEAVKLELTKENIKYLKELKGKIVKNRTQGLDVWQKKEKRFYLDGGRFIQTIYNKEVLVNQQMEETLEEAIKREENLEKERINKLIGERAQSIALYVEDPLVYNLGILDDVAFENLKKGLELGYQAKLQQEREAKEKEEKEKQASVLREQRKNELLPYWHLLPEEHRTKDFAFYSNDQWLIIMNSVKAKDAQEKKKQEEAEALQKKQQERMQQINPYLAFIADVQKTIELSDEEFANKLVDLEAQAEAKRKEEQEKAKVLAKRKERTDSIKPYLQFFRWDLEESLLLSDEEWQPLFDEAKKFFDDNEIKINAEKEQQRIDSLNSLRKSVIDAEYLTEEEKLLNFGKMGEVEFTELVTLINERKNTAISLQAAADALIAAEKAKKEQAEQPQAESVKQPEAQATPQRTTVKVTSENYLSTFKNIVESCEKLGKIDTTGSKYSKIQQLANTFVVHAQKILDEIK